jgi:hypothetical protein
MKYQFPLLKEGLMLKKFVLIVLMTACFIPGVFAKSMSTSFTITIRIPEKPASTEQITSDQNTPVIKEIRQGQLVMVQTSLSE